MRKVYQTQSNAGGFAAAVGIGVGLTGVLFGALPFSHIVNKPSQILELRKAGTADLPPPVEDLAPPPTLEPDTAPEAPPEPQLVDTPQAIPLTADLDVAAGSGGALAGFGEVRALTAVTAVQQDAFDVSDLEKRPEAVSQVAPKYPSALRKAKIEGVVTLIFILDEEGRVEDPRVENSSHPEFDKPALEAIRKWRFRPGIKDGQSVRTYIRIAIRFRVSAGA